MKASSELIFTCPHKDTRAVADRPTLCDFAFPLKMLLWKLSEVDDEDEEDDDDGDEETSSACPAKTISPD